MATESKMTAEEINALYDECLKKYSHEGEVYIGNDTITFFRRSSYEKMEDEEEDKDSSFINWEDEDNYVTGDEALIVFVNKEAVFGWYEPSEGEDMKNALEDVLSYLFKNRNITLKLHVTYSYDLDEFSSQNKKDIQEEIYKDLMSDFDVQKDQISNFTLSKDTDDYIVEGSANVLLTNPNDILYYIKYKEIPNDYTLFKYSIDESDENKDTFDDLFNFNVDLLY